MEPNATLDQASPAIAPRLAVASIGEPYAEAIVPQGSTIRTAQGSIPTILAAAHAGSGSAAASSLRFPGEDGGHSLAEMAQHDLDAALQLLADRAHYITGAAGAAIVLRRTGKADMQCRGSAGEIAPELGALLSIEFGLSGECVRTRQTVRCDDAERDRRVNREACRQMGIASVVIMPILQEDAALGVFELFSGKANAFGERDLSALKRLCEMVATAVRLANVAEELPERLLEVESPAEAEPADSSMPKEPLPQSTNSASAELPDATADQPRPAPRSTPPQSNSPAQSKPVPTRPLFWSVPLNIPSADLPEPNRPDQSRVPPVLRNLHQCQACGFPVSAGRSLCVECEEKKWRGQLRVSPPVTRQGSPPQARDSAALDLSAAPVASAASPRQASAQSGRPTAEPSASSRPQQTNSPQYYPDRASPPAPDRLSARSPDFILSAGLAASQSWASRNKYVLGALLVVAAAVAAILLLR